MLAVLQFDSPSLPLLERLLDEGRLPALSDLRRRGRWELLAAPEAALASAVYHTLHSGTEVAEHGLYHTFQWSAPEQRLRFMEAFPKPETVWERLSRAGRRSLVVDPYVSWPPHPMAGVCLSGWQCRHRILLQRWSVPSGAYGHLQRRHGRAPVTEEILGPPSVSRLLNLTQRLLRTPNRVADAVADLLAGERFDFTWITLAPAHFGGHWLWDPMQLVTGQVDAKHRSKLESALQDIYVAVDAALARIVAALPEDADVIVLSPAGIGTNTSRSDMLPGMLGAVLANGAEGHRSKSRRGSRIWRVRAALPTYARNAFSRLAPAGLNRELVARMYLQGIDWSQTKAFALPGDTSGLIRLNLRGRERSGIVDPGDAGALMEEIAAGLKTFHDPDGARSVEEIEQVQPQMVGARAGQLPDLLVRWSDRPSAGLAGVGSARFGDVARHGAGTGWPGNHVDQAWALMVPGRSRVRELNRPPRLVDIAATACGRLGVDGTALAGEPMLEAAASA
jgi:predicted AlkP superfamily phosphohydrolase/phosphomutase